MHSLRLRGLGWIVTLMLAGHGALAQDARLARQSLFDGQVTIEVPVALPPMPEDLRRIKYPNARTPFVAFSDANGEVSVVVNWTTHALAAKDVETHTKAFRAQFEKLPHILRWHATSIVTLNGQPVGILDFDSQAIDTVIHNKMMIATSGGRMLIATFNLTKRHETEWAPIADKVLQSIEFK
jgi:hypothetical protein